ncbi:DUF664 domain-containing protein [Cellulosimicrobium cellulans]|uniref:mycothiol transferase n=1 Tax=Cellulosimicrobium cellulans TaxID=1710 RepID=UPI003B969168
MTDHRTDPPVAADEVTTLRGFLDFHRDTLRWKTAGLDAAELAHRLRPSSMTLGGLLKHLAFVESQWFSQVFRGEELMPRSTRRTGPTTATGTGPPRRATRRRSCACCSTARSRRRTRCSTRRSRTAGSTG